MIQRIRSISRPLAAFFRRLKLAATEWKSSSSALSRQRFLLRKAMEGAEAPDEIQGWRSAHVAVGKQRLESLDCRFVGGITELRDNDDAVGDEEVAVAGGEALAVAK